MLPQTLEANSGIIKIDKTSGTYVFTFEPPVPREALAKTLAESEAYCLRIIDSGRTTPRRSGYKGQLTGEAIVKSDLAERIISFAGWGLISMVGYHRDEYSDESVVGLANELGQKLDYTVTGMADVSETTGKTPTAGQIDMRYQKLGIGHNKHYGGDHTPEYESVSGAVGCYQI